MKKLAILIATLLIVCLMACACGTVEETSTPDSSTETSSTQGTTSTPNETTSVPESSSADAGNNGGNNNPPAPVAGEIIDLGARAETEALTAASSTAIGTDLVIGDFTILGGCKYKDISAKPKASSDAKYSFTWQFQLAGPSSSGAIGGSYAEKSVRFSTTGPATLTLYCNRSTTDAVGCQVRVVNDSEAEVAVATIPDDGNKAYLITIAIPAAGNYALTGNTVSGVNVFGMGIA